MAGLSILLAACGKDASTQGKPELPSVVDPMPGIPEPYRPFVQALDANPASASGGNSARTAPVTVFDSLLWEIDANQPTPFHISNYYAARLARVATEMEQPVTTGFRVWAMYNHGFIVKTPTATVAFDLIEGKPEAVGGAAWDARIPDAILNRIDVLMVSHEHIDHWDLSTRIPAAIKSRGGSVVYPAAGLERAFLTKLMADREVFQTSGLRITAHAGLHNAPVNIYEVLTADGYRIVHTGDNQTSTSLPALQGVDVLLLNGWVNESGSTTNVVGMKRSIDKLRPNVMIPGHFESMSHLKSNRFRYTQGLQLQNDVLVRTKVVVLTWGEKMDYAFPACGAGLVRIYEACVAP